MDEISLFVEENCEAETWMSRGKYADYGGMCNGDIKS